MGQSGTSSPPPPHTRRRRPLLALRLGVGVTWAVALLLALNGSLYAAQPDGAAPIAHAGKPALLTSTETTGEPPSPETEGCTPPEGWVPYVVEEGDTLFEFVLLAEQTVTVDDLIAANCLPERWIIVGQTIYLPPGVIATPTPVPTATDAQAALATIQAACVRPEGWEPYTVQQDDTLFAFVLARERRARRMSASSRSWRPTACKSG